MEINNQLVRPLVERLYDDYKQLADGLPIRSSEEVQQLKDFLQKKLYQIEMLSSAFDETNGNISQKSLYPSLHDQIRDLKLQLRFAQRRWKRECLNETRFGKNRRLNSFLTPCAA